MCDVEFQERRKKRCNVEKQKDGFMEDGFMEDGFMEEELSISE